MRPGASRMNSRRQSQTQISISSDDSTRSMPRVEESALLSARDASELAGVLLPQEQAVLSSTPHPIVWGRPAARLAFLLAAAIIALSWQTHPIVAGHHRAIALSATALGRVLLSALAIAALVSAGQLLRKLLYYFTFRVIATNRRVFIIHSGFSRAMRPLGNTGMARSTLSQGVLGRLWNFGTIHTGEGYLTDMRHPVALWRSLEAVAHGVENGQWTPAVRQTLIP